MIQRLTIFFFLNRKVILACTVFASLLFGIQLWVIASFGNATPCWDQWDLEAGFLYQPFFEGRLAWNQLTAFHGSHRFFTSRLLALALLRINGIWNPLLQMIVHAGLRVVGLMLVIILTARVVGRERLALLLLFATGLFFLPYGWQNMLIPLPPFYFVILFSVISLWLLMTKSLLSSWWWVGVLCGVLSCLSLASGVFSFGAGAGTVFLIYAAGSRRTMKQLCAFAVLLGAFVFALQLMLPLVPVNDATFKAMTSSEFFHAVLKISSWPLDGSWHGAFFRNFPSLVFLGCMVLTKPHADDRRWFLVSLILWGIGQVVSIAYGRATCGLESRYLDLFSISIFLNFSCLLLWKNRGELKWRLAVMGVRMVWAGCILGLLWFRVGPKLLSELRSNYEIVSIQESNTRSYVATGDIHFLKDKPFRHIPYPDFKRLSMLLDVPVIRTILPSNIRRPLKFLSIERQPFDAIVENGYDPTMVSAQTHRVWGTFGAQGARTTGEAWIRFDADPSWRIVAIPVVGYPVSRDIRIEVEQGGQQRFLNIKRNLKGLWGMVYAKVGKGPFCIHVTDLSTKSWVAVGAPRAAGRLDPLVDWLLVHWFLFVLLGLGSGVVLMAERGWKIFGILQTG
ncbi:MAG TPA: hypothetical protein VLJ10_03030, partial [Candidatus Bathyarchaeia archaeon]|nr:hypothetical protein [Candidatus Bathyarchaeia archaeon]